MDKLYEAALYYKQELLSRKFHLIAVNKTKRIELDIKFSAYNFTHLFALQKLTDIPKTQESGGKPFFNILNKQLSYDDLMKSQYFFKAKDRIDNYTEVVSALKGKKLMLKSLHRNFFSIVADYMLTKSDEKYGYAHLFLKDDEKKGIVVPVTFIIQEDNLYLRNQAERWTVLSIEEVKK